MAEEIQVPDFRYMPALYAELRRALRLRGRVTVPELTVEADTDPFMQLEQVVALMGHYSSVLGDWLARHMYLPTSLYRPLVAAQLATIDERLAAATPATADLVARLTRAFTADEPELVPALSRFSTVPTPGVAAVTFESPAEAVGCSRTDQLLYVAYDQGAAAYLVPAIGADLWPSAAEAGDLLYIGHPDLLFDACAIPLGLAGSGIAGCWEYHGRSEATPDAVVLVGPQLRFTLTTLLGAAVRTGAQVTILCTRTGRAQTFSSTWSGTVNQVVTTETFGQTVLSTNPSDYLCSIEWTELPGIGGGNDDLDSTAESDVSWTLPQTLVHSWQPCEIAGVEGCFVRFRVISVVAPVEPRLSAAIGPGEADFYVLFLGTQGQTVDDTVGTSDGSASQAFALSRAGCIDGTLTSLTVGTDPDWVVTTEASDLYAAAPVEKIALLELLPDGTQQLLFGDGIHGAIPPGGDAIVASYRIDADDDGNVGATAISRNTSGVGYLTEIRNPRPAAGWAAAEGSTAADLERVKRVKPASLRARDRAITEGDCSALACDDFRTAGGSRAVARAWCVAELYGLKTFGLVTVGNGGGVLSADVLAELEEWFNGADPNSTTRRLLANYELTASSFSPRAISGAVNVSVRRSATGVEAAVKAILAAQLTPLATFEDGSYRWEPGRYGGQVAPNQLEALIAEQLVLRRAIAVEVTDLNGDGAVPVALLADELPVYAGDAFWTVAVTVLP